MIDAQCAVCPRSAWRPDSEVRVETMGRDPGRASIMFRCSQEHRLRHDAELLQLYGSGHLERI